MTIRGCHNGQLKLLLSEIAFLERFRGSPHKVVYAGASPGFHVVILAGLFPEMRFLLIDPKPSAIQDNRLPNVVSIETPMTSQLADELRKRYTTGPPILFISDVRVGVSSEKEQSESAHEHQSRIHRDMVAQSEWFFALKPKAGLLKFRLPWDLVKHTHYMEGTIFLPVFGRPLTHETRLAVMGPCPSMKVYDNTTYERQMAYFNQFARPTLYWTGRCYDCTAFTVIVASYLRMAPHEKAVGLECARIEGELTRLKSGWFIKNLAPPAMDGM